VAPALLPPKFAITALASSNSYLCLQLVTKTAFNISFTFSALARVVLFSPVIWSAGKGLKKLIDGFTFSIVQPHFSVTLPFCE
jgi:hypothetical protein